MYSRAEYSQKRTYQENYIRKHFNMEYSTKYLGRQNRDGWECYAYTVTLKDINYSNPGKYTISYYNGTRHTFKNSSKPCPPLPFAVLYSIYSDNPKGATFEEWCAEYDYDTDSRKALATYMACQEQTTKFRRAFPGANLEEHEEITQY